ncbi:EF-P beta-lysylation protein EpmB [Paraferrimonas sedimenticola]|uniref:L-lysine 2,3-aminomutase n=1 Tax=Paraferrimonas sedimenticola TaxID=375674 RepID=A0AA37RY53_9GAMM|nr:EF-P beta-lysylation protein EpmB [Paraferrimonas sedimenticola]GLP97283.1 EF-P beta-lysylation protein EpmB [Paraferrimonas sedimenticola]
MITRIPANLHSDWQKELAQCVTDPTELLTLVSLDPADYQQHIKARRLFPMRVPRHFVGLMKKGDPNDPLLRQVLPLADEFVQAPGFSTDPLQEQQAAQPGLLHKYQSRVLVMLKGGCAVNCRYCFRRHFPYQDNSMGQAQWQQTLEYLTRHPELNEVIFSGGDPLMAKDAKLEQYARDLEAIPHIKRLRIHTRLPVVMPSRLTEALTQTLSQSRLQTVLVLHANHPNEISAQLADSLRMLKASGVTLLNQSVLLKGVNDSPKVLAALSERLFDAGVLPYYLHLLDKVDGAQHFDLPHASALELMQHLLKLLPGFLVPKLVREEAHQSSKTPIDLGPL